MSTRLASSVSSTFAVLLGGLMIQTGCVPPFAEFQGARLVGPGAFEVTPFYSSVWFSDEGETERIQNHFGVAAAVGVTESLDLRFRYERVSLIDIEGDVNVLSAGPKFRLVEDRVAFAAPIGAGFGEDVETSETWQIHPTLLFTFPAGDALDVDASAKVLFPFDRDIDDFLAFTLGLGIRAGETIMIRPEGGYLLNPGEDGSAFHLGVGIAIRGGNR